MYGLQAQALDSPFPEYEAAVGHVLSQVLTVHGKKSYILPSFEVKH
jgi:hypothetical protein